MGETHTHTQMGHLYWTGQISKTKLVSEQDTLAQERRRGQGRWTQIRTPNGQHGILRLDSPKIIGEQQQISKQTNRKRLKVTVQESIEEAMGWKYNAHSSFHLIFFFFFLVCFCLFTYIHKSTIKMATTVQCLRRHQASRTGLVCAFSVCREDTLVGSLKGSPWPSATEETPHRASPSTDSHGQSNHLFSVLGVFRGVWGLDAHCGTASA